MPLIPERHLLTRSIAASLIVSTLLLVNPLHVVEAQETAAQQMARAIARMMETMGFTGSRTYPAVPAPVIPDTLNPMGMGSWPSTFMGSVAGHGSGQSAGAAPGAQTWGASVLEGIWEDNQGGLLIVQGTFYRLYSSCHGYIEGDISVSGNRIELTNRSEGFSRGFEFAQDQGRLALRDDSGQIYVYRRLILGRPDH